MCTSVLGCLQGGLVKVLPCGPYGPAAVLGHCRLFSPMPLGQEVAGAPDPTKCGTGDGGPGVSNISAKAAPEVCSVFGLFLQLLRICCLSVNFGRQMDPNWAHHVARLVAQHPPPLLPRSALACNWGRFLDLAGLLPFSQIEQVRRCAGNIEHRV